MICVSIGCNQQGAMEAEYRRLSALGAQLVELRVDQIEGNFNVEHLLANRPGPAIVTCRRTNDNGNYRGGEDDRLAMLRSAISAGADYVDLEEDAARRIPRFGSSKRIVSFHDFAGTPDDLEQIHRRLCSLDADVVKICTMATRPADNLRMLRLVQASKTPTVGFCMGEFGLPTRLLCGKFGSPWTYASGDKDRPLAPAQISFEEMVNLYRYDHIGADTPVYGVIADPVGHSMSPLIHNTAFAAIGLNSVYLPIRVSPAHLGEFMATAPELGIRGLSVTIPHKEAVIELLDRVDDAARGIGAVNTVVFDGGRGAGYNTDYEAAMASLETAVGVRAGGKQTLAGRGALVLGSGGVGRAIAFGLVERGALVTLCDGDRNRAVRLADELGCRFVEWAARHDVVADIVVNCTPIGMYPNVDATPFDKQCLRPSMVVFDAVYNPEETQFIQNAREFGCTCVTGVDMFVRQAALQFKLFTGRKPPTDVMRAAMMQAMRAK